MRILMIISEAPPIKSGVSRVAEKLSDGLKNLGYSIDLLSLKDIPRFEWGEMRLSSMPLKLSSIKKRMHNYDIVNLHGPVPTFSDVFLLSGLRGLNHKRPRLVYTYHAPVDLKNILLQPLIWSYNKSQEWLANLADHVVVTTHSYGLRLSRHVPIHKLSVIPWGVDYTRFSTPIQKEGPYTVVYLGQIRPYKGLPILLEASQGMQGIRLWVIGNGHSADTYRRQAFQMGIHDVTFWGQIPDEDMARLVKKADVLVLPSISRSEAFGIALLEGMAAGLVPVASHLPGVADLIGNEGITFPPGNAQALRDVLIRLRDDVAWRAHLAGLAQAKARLYSWERAVFGYDRIYQNLLAKPLGLGDLIPADIRSKSQIQYG